MPTHPLVFRDTLLTGLVDFEPAEAADMDCWREFLCLGTHADHLLLKERYLFHGGLK